MPFVSAVIVAGGSSVRMGEDKLFLNLRGETPVERSLDAFERSPLVDEIVVSARADALGRVKALCSRFSKVSAVAVGGENRFFSTVNGINAVSERAEYVAIHDAARPLASTELINRVIEAAFRYGAAAPGVPLSDTVKITDGEGFTESTPDRSRLRAVSTPQVFELNAYRQAAKGQTDALDDCQLLERAGKRVFLVDGEKTNIKLTTKEDITVARAYLGGNRMRVGHGYDVHRLVEGRKLILGGVEIPYEKGLLGHSDADVLLHAIMDSLLGAAALGDIGKLFPDTDKEYEGINSLILLDRTGDAVRKAGYEIENIDATVVCQRPKLKDYIGAMIENIARELGIDSSQVSVKATTEEGLGFTGSGEGIAAHAVSLISG